MLAIVYVLLMVAVGDAIGRRFFPILSLPQRYASAFIVGLLSCSWYTYLLGLLFAGWATPLVWANLVFFATAVALIYYFREDEASVGANTRLDVSETDFKRPDWIILAIFVAFAFWMMFRTFAMTNGYISFGHHQFPDFGSTVSIMQSFAIGNNFPTEFPHFTGDGIRYHFLYYFQAGNLEYLGLNPAWANNLLSALSLSSLLVSIMTLGSLVFRSRVAGRIGAALFFFHGSLAFIPFFLANPSFAAVMDKLSKMTLYLNSGLPYRGEDWGVWSQNVFLNQRHFTSGIAMFLLVLIFLFARYRESIEPVEVVETSAGDAAMDAENTELAELPEETEIDVDTSDATANDEGTDIGADVGSVSNVVENDAGAKLEAAEPNESPFKQYAGFIFCGAILGLMPMWNGAVFLSAAVVLAVFLLVYPLRREMMAVALTAAVIGLPQYYYLVAGARPAGFSIFRWGFNIDNAGFFDVLYYIFFTFGFKWVLIAAALYFASSLQRRLFAAIFVLFPLTFCFRFSEEVLTSHKFLNIWLVIANLFVAFALVKLWHQKTGSTKVPIRILATALALLVTIGGAIDLVPIWNSYFITMKYKDDPLVEWVKANTDPRAIFLSHRYINHQILLAGRKIFFGDPYYAWSAGYDVPTRERLVRQMFETTDPAELYRLLKENNISFIAVDDMVRKNPNLVPNPNESMIANYYPVVFTDDRNQYANIKIYKVPDSPPTALGLEQPKAEQPAKGLFEGGGEGTDPGRFITPRGIAVDASGNIYIADTGNSRIQKFDPSGTFISAFGVRGDGPGQFQEPNGVAVDAEGNIYVTDAKRHKLIRVRFDLQFDKEWEGPTGKFYGPRDLFIAPNKQLYIIDQGGTRIAEFDPATEEFETWGSGGAGEGQFSEPTGIAIGGGTIYIADAGNDRIQLFDLKGKFLSQIAVPAWERAAGNFPDIAFDEKTKTIYVSSGRTNEILGIKEDGALVPGFRPDAEHLLDNPSSMIIVGSGSNRMLLVVNTKNARVARYALNKQ